MEKNIFNLDVSVGDSFGMHVHEPLAEVDHDVDDLGLAKLSFELGNQVEQTSFRAQLCQDIHLLAHCVVGHVDEAHDVGVPCDLLPHFHFF